MLTIILTTIISLSAAPVSDGCGITQEQLDHITESIGAYEITVEEFCEL